MNALAALSEMSLEELTDLFADKMAAKLKR